VNSQSDLLQVIHTLHSRCRNTRLLNCREQQRWTLGAWHLSVLEKSIAANKFNKGYETLEYVSAALLDLGWHSISTDEVPSDVVAFENQLLTSFGMDYAPVPPRYRTSYFAHVWSGGYSAGYYAYLWSEVLAADAFAHMGKLGGLTAANGAKFRESILSRGGTREMMQQFKDFRGQEPTVDALLIRRGLK